MAMRGWLLKSHRNTQQYKTQSPSVTRKLAKHFKVCKPAGRSVHMCAYVHACLCWLEDVGGGEWVGWSVSLCITSYPAKESHWHKIIQTGKEGSMIMEKKWTNLMLCNWSTFLTWLLSWHFWFINLTFNIGYTVFCQHKANITNWTMAPDTMMTDSRL